MNKKQLAILVIPMFIFCMIILMMLQVIKSSIPILVLIAFWIIFTINYFVKVKSFVNFDKALLVYSVIVGFVYIVGLVGGLMMFLGFVIH